MVVSALLVLGLGVLLFNTASSPTATELPVVTDPASPAAQRVLPNLALPQNPETTPATGTTSASQRRAETGLPALPGITTKKAQPKKSTEAVAPLLTTDVSNTPPIASIMSTTTTVTTNPIPAYTPESNVPVITQRNTVALTSLTPKPVPLPRTPRTATDRRALTTLPLDGTLTALTRTAPKVGISTAPPPPQPSRLRWSVGAEVGYGAHFRRYAPVGVEQQDYRAAREAAETPLDAYSAKLFGQVGLQGGWFVRAGASYGSWQTRTTLRETTVVEETFDNVVTGLVRQTDGSFVSETGVATGEVITVRESRVYARDRRIGLRVGGGKRWALPNRTALVLGGGLAYYGYQSTTGRLLGPDGTLVEAVQPTGSDRPLALYLHTDYQFQHYRISLFSEGDLRGAAVGGLMTKRTVFGVSVGVLLGK